MSDKKINGWHDAITPRETDKPWVMGSGGSWDLKEVQPIPDEMLSELAQRYHYAGTPWNCRSMPLTPSDREYMFLLYYSMQGMVARMRKAEGHSTPMLLEDDMKALKRFQECCEDFDSGGHDVSRDRMSRLTEIGVVRHLGFGNHMITAFGDYVLDMDAGELRKFPLKAFVEYNSDAKTLHDEKLAAMAVQSKDTPP